MEEIELVLLGHDYAGPPDADDATQPAPLGGLPSLQSAHRTHVYTATHAPKAAMAQWAKLLADVI